MLRIYPKIKKTANNVFLYLQKIGNGKHEHILIKKGENTVIEGGYNTGKTAFLEKSIRQLTDNGVRCIYVNGSLPISDWVKDYRLFGKNLQARIEYFMRSLPSDFYLFISFAEKIQESRKLDVIIELLDKARSSVIACTSFSLLHGRLKVRLSNARIHSLGAGSDTFDITYFVVAIMIVFVALTGHQSIIFLAAAFRYLFQGTRMGGRRL